MAWTNDQTWALVNKPEPEEIRLVDLINKPDPEEIYHHGIKGQRWGIRRYQNPDGSLTPEGKERYGDEDDTNKDDKNKERITGEQVKNLMNRKGFDYEDVYKEMGVSEDEEDNDVYKEAEYSWYEKHKNDNPPGKYADKFSFNKTLSEVYNTIDTKGSSERISQKMYRFCSSKEFGKLTKEQQDAAVVLLMMAEGWGQDSAWNWKSYNRTREH